MNGGSTDDNKKRGALVVQSNGSFEATDTLFRDFTGFALDVDDGATVEAFKRNRLEGRGDSIRIAPDLVEMLDYSCEFSNAGSTASQARIVIGSGAVTAPVVWPALDASYQIEEDLIVTSGILKFSQGADLQFARDAQLIIKQPAALSVQGSEGAPVVFHGAEDTPGFWGGIVFDSDRLFRERLCEQRQRFR